MMFQRTLCFVSLLCLLAVHIHAGSVLPVDCATRTYATESCGDIQTEAFCAVAYEPQTDFVCEYDGEDCAATTDTCFTDRQDVTLLRQSDFDNGTVRLTDAGWYILVEDVAFNPNPEDNWMPRPEQASVYPFSKYHLGFFAAITVEGSGIIVDGGGHRLEQSETHYLQQRFFSVIELADQPFIPGQGPSLLGPTIAAANHSVVQNIILGLSSHHAIHGNAMENVVLKDIVGEHFEIAGIALNGGSNLLLEDIVLRNTSKVVPTKATYSHARFLQPFWAFANLSAPITLRGVETTGADIKAALDAEMAQTFNEFQSSSALSSALFRNDLGVADGNQYGIVLNAIGVAVNQLPTSRDSASGNVNITVRNVSIQNMLGSYQEVPALPTTVNHSTYTFLGAETGPVGDVFRYHEYSDGSGHYVGNTLADAQIFLSAQGFGSISEATREWAAQASGSLNVTYFVGNADSMAHFSKGTIGMLIAAGDDIHLENVDISNVQNVGEPSILDHNEESFVGSSTFGMVLAASTNLDFDNVSISGVLSQEAVAVGVGLKNATMPVTAPSVSGLQGGSVAVRPLSNPTPGEFVSKVL